MTAVDTSAEAVERLARNCDCHTLPITAATLRALLARAERAEAALRAVADAVLPTDGPAPYPQARAFLNARDRHTATANPAAVIALCDDHARLRAERDAAREVVRFFASVIKSGEEWTHYCETELRRALPAPPSPEAAHG